MKCPHCDTSINLEEYGTSIYGGDKNEEEYGISHGWCPECDGFIVLMKKGTGVYSKELDSYTMFDEIKEESFLFPKYNARCIKASEVPDKLRNDFNEAAMVLEISPKASAAISRRCLQTVLREYYKIKKRNLAEEIGGFLTLKDIPSFLSDAVDAVRHIGNFAAHPMKDTNTGEIVEVEPGEAEWLLEVLETLYDFSFIQPRRLAERKEKLNKKLESLGKPKMKDTSS